MKAMILSAGRGERMRPLSDHQAKPLMKVGKHRLIEHHLFALKKAGITEVIINVSYLAQSIMNTLGNGDRYGIQIHYSVEDEALETGGGIIKALPLLGEAPFWVINGDVFTDFSFDLKIPDNRFATLLMIDNPEHHRQGDFSIEQGDLILPSKQSLTFSGIGLYKPEFFADFVGVSHCKLADIIRANISKQAISGVHFSGRWIDVGTPERLAQANKMISVTGT